MRASSCAPTPALALEIENKVRAAKGVALRVEASDGA